LVIMINPLEIIIREPNIIGNSMRHLLFKLSKSHN
jgi:hypothetical protein